VNCSPRRNKVTPGQLRQQEALWQGTGGAKEIGTGSQEVVPAAKPVVSLLDSTILLEGQQEYAMFVDLKKRYHWVLEPFQYKSVESLLAELTDHIIVPAEAKAHELIKE
jgi:hypothetical protein